MNKKDGLKKIVKASLHEDSWGGAEGTLAIKMGNATQKIKMLVVYRLVVCILWDALARPFGPKPEHTQNRRWEAKSNKIYDE